MIIIPAIDIIDGKVVRLFKGEYDKKTVYSDHPAEVALAWQTQGAEWIHIVDLDGAAIGRPVNLKLIGDVTKSLNIPVELGGGLRTMADLKKVFNKGISRAILGSAAFEDKEFLKEAVALYQDKIAVSIDARDGMVASHGWTEMTKIEAKEAAIAMEKMGVKTIVFTDIDTDGTLSGPNFKSLSGILETVNVSVIASGGVSSSDDIISLKNICPRPPYGAIIGRALYEKTIDLKEVIGKGK